jgi:hypothetical protein
MVSPGLMRCRRGATCEENANNGRYYNSVITWARLPALLSRQKKGGPRQDIIHLNWYPSPDFLPCKVRHTQSPRDWTDGEEELFCSLAWPSSKEDHQSCAGHSPSASSFIVFDSTMHLYKTRGSGRTAAPRKTFDCLQTEHAGSKPL